MVKHPPDREARQLRLAPAVRLRREHFGGIACDTQTGTTIDVDRGAFALLSVLRHGGVLCEDQLREGLPRTKGRRGSPAQMAEVIQRLLSLGVIVVAMPEEAIGRDRTQTVKDAAVVDESTSAWPAGPRLTAPETVHWAITYACNMQCPDCYARRHHQWSTGELGTRDALRLVDRLAEWSVLQLAIGGGEPLLRCDLRAITQRAREHGLVVHVTTGDQQALLDHARTLAPSVSAFQLGIKADRLLTDAEAEVAMLSRCVGLAEDLGVSLGANLILSKSVIAHFERLISLLAQARITRITLLRYKPPGKVARWVCENPPPEMIGEFEGRLAIATRRHPEMTFRLDCALSFLQRRVVPETALAAGIRGCVAAQRILAVAPDGSAFPCSQLVHPDACAGNLLTDDPDEVWRQSTVMKRYRSFREPRRFRETLCGVCTARHHCGGCRIFADYARGADPGCPEPLLPAPKALGKIGRKVDLRQYMDQRGSVSVRQYMKRYGVGQRRAVRELKSTDWLVSEPSGTGRKLSDVYSPIGGAEDLIAAIQDSIGYTSGGSPYATREEIAEWIAHDPEEEGSGYPKWLLPSASGEEAGLRSRQGSRATESEMGDDDDEDYQCSQGIRL